VSPADKDDELLDLVDDDDHVTGTVRRGDCHGSPWLQHRAVHVFVLSSQGDYFLQKRSRAKRIAPGRWDTSVGGHVCAGETYEQAAAKELQEELGVRLADPSALVYRHDYVWHSSIETEHVRTFVLHADGPFTLEAAEIDDGRFWTVAEMIAAVGTGAFTQNLEEEMRKQGLTCEPRSGLSSTRG
jgi:isopentenyldiphosphate isomerase